MRMSSLGKNFISIIICFAITSLLSRELWGDETVAITPTRFMEIQFPELSPEESHNFEKMRQELVEQDYTAAFPKLRGFLIMSPKKWLLNDGNSEFETCASACKKLIAGLPTDGIRKWREFTDEIVSATLKSENLSENALKQLLRENPHSTYEEEILELLRFRARRADEAPITPEARPEWTVTMTEVRTPEGVAVFEDFLPLEQRGTFFADRKRNETAENRAVSEFLTFSPDRNFLVARLGTQVTRWMPEEINTRPQAYLVVLDTTRDGLLVWLTTPETVQRALVGNPLADENHVYIPTVKLGKQAEFALDTYSLADGTLLRRDELFTVSWENVHSGEDTEIIHLPIRWTEPGKILIGSPDSGVEILWETE